MIQNILNRLRNILHSSVPIQQELIGIDVSHNYVRVIQLSKKNNVWSIIKLASKSIQDIDDNPLEKEKEIVKLLKAIRLEQNFETNNAAVSIPVSSAIVQVLQIPFLEEVELNAAITNGSLWESSISLPGDLSEYSIFWQVIKKAPEKNQMSLLFVASRIDEIERHCNLIRSAGFDPLIVDVRCFALRNILRTYSNKEPPLLSSFLEISGNENYAVFINDGLPFIYDIFVSEEDKEALRQGGKSLTNEVFNRIGSQLRTAVASFLKQSSIPGIEKIDFVSSLPNFDLLYKGLKKEILEFKIENLNPLSQIRIPAHLQERINTEKNISSLAVSAGLATRQLDIFGYFKFITAVSNINLLPNRQEIIEKEKKKIEASAAIIKTSWVSMALASILALAYAILLSMAPSTSTINVLREKADALEAEYKKDNINYEALKYGVDSLTRINKKLIDISFLQALPRGAFIIELNQKKKDLSEISLKSTNPGLASSLILEMSSRFKNVKLNGVEGSANDGFQISKITYRID
jgi:type IV pilus assembly protein PilN